jgi:hypothetical protein
VVMRAFLEVASIGPMTGTFAIHNLGEGPPARTWGRVCGQATRAVPQQINLWHVLGVNSWTRVRLRDRQREQGPGPHPVVGNCCGPRAAQSGSAACGSRGPAAHQLPAPRLPPLPPPQHARVHHGGL